MITTHGGPTSSASPDLNWQVQYYTSRGWAVADVNYGGSTGYGRDYRTRLNARWGQLDVADCVACVRHLAATGRADPARVAIRGGSAGGYTTLAALAFTDVFRAGASHYGVGDLTALDRDTHKFESRYLGTLVGDADALRERSPINHVDRLNCPVIFFQGTEDRIVPPNQAEAMRDAAREQRHPRGLRDVRPRRPRIPARREPAARHRSGIRLLRARLRHRRAWTRRCRHREPKRALVMKVAVLAGGNSAEASVSRSSAAGVARALDSRGHDVTVVEVDGHLIKTLGDLAPDVVFPVPARATWRRRHDPRTADDARAAVCRQRCPRLRGGHGQACRQGAVSNRRTAGRP